MKKTKIIFSFLALGLGISVIPVFADDTELNSGNVGTLCILTDTALDCSNHYAGITSVAADTFVAYPNITSLRLDYNAINNIAVGAFNGLSNLQSLALNWNALTGLINTMFVWLSGLQSLDLSYNQITSIENWAFAGLGGAIYIGYNALTTISSGMFMGSAGITTLSIVGNQITSIETGVFADISGSIALDYNSLTTITNWMFSGATKVTQLTMIWNQISSIENWAFKDLNAIESISLQSNSFTTLKNGNFNGLNSLTTLDLRDNQISTIESWVFGSNLLAMQYIYLDNNSILATQLDQTTLDLFNIRQTGWQALQKIYGCINPVSNNYNAFATIDDHSCNTQNVLNSSNIIKVCSKSATTCNLSNKNIVSIAPNTFLGYENLQVLSLNSNKITKISKNTFKGLSALQNLSLARNSIGDIESWAINSLSELTTINLRESLLNAIRVWMFDWLTKLTSLNLMGNQIRTIESQSFMWLAALLNLDLKYNRLVVVANWEFDGLSPYPTYIDLRDNCLDSTSAATTEYFTSFAVERTYQYVCPDIVYTPDSSTTGEVVGTLFFTWWDIADRNKLMADNPTFSATHTHIRTWNGLYSFAYGNIVDTNYKIRPKYDRSKRLVSAVTWIIDPVNTAFTSVYTGLQTAGVESNLSDIDSTNYSNFSGLTFEKRTDVNDPSTSFGSITFDSALDLSNPDTQSFLQDLWSRLNISSGGVISLDFRGVSNAVALKWVSATIKFRNLDKLGFTWSATAADVLAKLVAYDDDGNLLDTWALLASSGTYVGACGVGETECYTFSIKVNHFTTYKINANTPAVVPATPAANQWWGGGGGWFISTDNCPNGDYSPSHYDGICGTKPTVIGTGINASVITDEIVSAYKWALGRQITTMKTLEAARVGDPLTRGEMAKMIVNYAVNNLWKVINTGKQASFSDLKGQTTEMKDYMTKANQLWLMWVNSKTFNPNGLVTRGEFSTILARLLYNITYDWVGLYYSKPLATLSEKWIIKNTNPLLQEARGYVMLMLMRATK